MSVSESFRWVSRPRMRLLLETAEEVSAVVSVEVGAELEPGLLVGPAEEAVVVSLVT